MAIKKVWIEDGCTACGMCEETCSSVFKVEDLATVIKGVHFADYEAQIKEASDSCPVEIIKYE